MNDNAELLSNLEKLICFGGIEISKIKLDMNKNSIKMLTLFSQIGAFHNYSEAALLLAKSKKTYAGEVLLRSLIENFITMEYILLENGEINAVRFHLKYLIKLIEFVTKWKDFITDNPKHSNYFEELSNPQKCDSFINERKNEIRDIKNKFGNIKNIPDLKEMAKQIDKQRGNTSYELLHLTLYEYLCNLSHVSSKGLKNFFNEYKNGYVFSIGKSSDEKNFGLLVAIYEFYLEVIRLFSIEFKISLKTNLRPFEDYFNILKNQNNK